MKKYSNHKFNLVEDDDIVSTTTSKTDMMCVILVLIAMLLVVGMIIFTIRDAKAEARAYRAHMEQELCNLMEFNGSPYRCDK